MSLISTFIRKLRTTAVFILLPLLACSCQWITDDYEDETVDSDATHYINFTLTVNANEAQTTRAPQGGEYGDGREAAFIRENTVEGITLILYKGTGIDDATAKVDFVRYYPVSIVSRDNQGKNTYTNTKDQYEAVYTTGDQKLEQDEVDFNAKYHVLIIANQNLATTFPKGTLISTVRDYQIQNIYTTPTNVAQPHGYEKFVMTTETDATIDFTDMTPVPMENSTTGLAYRFNNLLLIERLTARIDYYTVGSTYNTARHGYEYIVKDEENNINDTGDRFVVTKVTPFNLYNENEYLFKRVRNNWTDATPTITYLGDESTSNYVIDPNTANKDNSHTFSYLSPIAENMSSTYAQTMSALNEDQKYKISDKDNIIIAYPMENTLKPNSSLKKYATGLAFEGYYYPVGSSEGQKLVFYYFLRHQGENNSGSGSYQAKQWKDIKDSDVSHDGTAMNYGIVRNNIYRVSIEKVNVVKGTIKLIIEEEKWRHVDNPPIYI